MDRTSNAAEERINKLGLDLSRDPDDWSPIHFWMQQGGKRILVGYLVHDDYCENPIEICEGNGKFIFDKQCFAHIGRDENGDPSIDSQLEILARLKGVDVLELNNEDCKIARNMWEEALDRSEIGTKYALPVIFTHHGQISESSGPSIDGVWIPDPSALEHIDSFPEEERNKKAREVFECAVEEYNKWAEGDCWGVVVDEFEKKACGEYHHVDDDTCWGYVGADWAKNELADSMKWKIKYYRDQLKKGKKEMQLEYALPIIRALADGVNPFTGEAYPEHSPYAEPRTLRALYAAFELMEKEVEREKRRERLPANFGKPWTEGEDKVLVTEFESGIPLPEIARKHYRTASSIRLRLEKLGKITPAT